MSPGIVASLSWHGAWREPAASVGLVGAPSVGVAYVVTLGLEVWTGLIN